MTTDELTTQFVTFQGELKSFLLRMTASMQDAEDIVQETYVKAATKIDTFRGESSLKTWVFSIASNLARDFLRAKKRWPETVTDICREEVLENENFFRKRCTFVKRRRRGTSRSRNTSLFASHAFPSRCPLEEHLVLLLKEVYGFKVVEIAQIAQLSEAMVKYHLHVSRGKMMAIFDRRCSLINKQGICHQCTELNGIFNPNKKRRRNWSRSRWQAGGAPKQG